MGSKKYRKRHRKGIDSNDNDDTIKVTEFVSALDKENEKNNKARHNSTNTSLPLPNAGNGDNSVNGSKKSRKRDNAAEKEDLNGLIGFRYETCLGPQSDATEGKRIVLSNYLVQRCSMGGYRQSNSYGANGPTYTSVKQRKQFYPETLRESFMLQNFQFVLPPSGHFAPSSKVGVLGSTEVMGEETPHRVWTASDRVEMIYKQGNNISVDLLTLDFDNFFDGSLEKRSMEQRRKMTKNLESCVDSYDRLFEWDSVLFVVYKGTSFENCPRDFRCPICLEMPIAPRLTKCGHLFCYSCILRSMNAQKFLGVHYGGSNQVSSNPHWATFGNSDVLHQNMTPLQQQEAYRQQEVDRANYVKEANKKRTCPICSCDVCINDLRPCILQVVDSLLTDKIVNIPASGYSQSHYTNCKVTSPKGHSDYMFDPRDEGASIRYTPESSVASSSVSHECSFTLVCRRVGSSVVTEGDAFQRHKYIMGFGGDIQEEEFVENSNITCDNEEMELSNSVLIPQYGSGDAIFSRYCFATFQLIESQMKTDMLDLRRKLKDMNSTIPRPFSDDDGYEYSATESALKLLLRNGYNYSQYSSLNSRTIVVPGGSPSTSDRNKRGHQINSSPDLRSSPVFPTRMSRSNPTPLHNNSDIYSSENVTPTIGAVSRTDSISPMMNEMMLPATTHSLTTGKNNTINRGINGERKGNTGTELLWFYQESSGQHVYLHPLNLSMLKRQFSARGQYMAKINHNDIHCAMPPQLQVPIQEVITVTQTEETRRRTREAPHVPLGSTFKVVFVDLSATGLLSEEVLLHFKEPLAEKYQSLRNVLRKKNNERSIECKLSNKGGSRVNEIGVTQNVHTTGDMESLAGLNLTETEIMWLNESNDNANLLVSSTAASAFSVPRCTSDFDGISTVPLYLSDGKGKISVSDDSSLYPALADIPETFPGRSYGVWESPPNTINAKQHVIPKESTVSEYIPLQESVPISGESFEEEEIVETGRRKRKKKNRWTLVEVKKNKRPQCNSDIDVRGDSNSVSISGQGMSLKSSSSREVAALPVVIVEGDAQRTEAGDRHLSTPPFGTHTEICDDHLIQLYDEMEELEGKSSSAGTSLVGPPHHVKFGGEGISQRQAKRLEAIIAADRTRVSIHNIDFTSSGVSTPLCSPLLAPQNNPYTITCISPPTTECNSDSRSPCQSLMFVKNKKDKTRNQGPTICSRSNPFEVLASNTKKAAYNRGSNADLTNLALPPANDSLERGAPSPLELSSNNATNQNITQKPEDSLVNQEWAMRAATESYRKLHLKATPHAQPNWTGTPMKPQSAPRNDVAKTGK